MITREGDCYIMEGTEKIVNETREKGSQSIVLQGKGSVAERLKAIRNRLSEISAQKQSFLKINTTNPLHNLTAHATPVSQQSLLFFCSMHIPTPLLALEHRLSKCQEKILPTQVYRQKIITKGTVVDRIKYLQEQIQKLKEKKNLQNCISVYSNIVDEKQDQFKGLFLYDILTKAQALGDQISCVFEYLNNLNKTQTKIKALPSLQKVGENHNALIKKQKLVQTKMESLFKHMTENYNVLLRQIQSIQ